MNRLETVLGDEPLVFDNNKTMISIGSDDDNDFVFKEKLFSGKHCKFTRTKCRGEITWALSDLGSRCGTFLNGERCKRGILYNISCNDIVGIGTGSRDSRRQGPLQTWVWEILSPTGVIETCRSAGVEESLIARYINTAMDAVIEVDTITNKDRKNSASSQEIKISSIRNVFSDEDDESDNETETIFNMERNRDFFSPISNDDLPPADINETNVDLESISSKSDFDKTNQMSLKTNKKHHEIDNSTKETLDHKTVVHTNTDDERENDNLLIINDDDVDKLNEFNEDKLDKAISDVGGLNDQEKDENILMVTNVGEEGNKNDEGQEESTENDGDDGDEEADEIFKIVSIESSDVVKFKEEERDTSSRSSAEFNEVEPDKNKPCNVETLRRTTFKCNQCPKVFNKLKKYQKHVMKRHGNYKVSTGEGASLRLTVKKEKSGPGLLSSTWQQSVISRNLKCRKCYMETTERRGLYIHYALRHYKEEIIDKIGGESLMDLSPKKLSNSSIQCPESGCNMRKRQINDLIAHVAIDHNYIEDFLPKHWHVIKETKEESTDKNTRMESNSATNRNEADDKMCNETDESASIEDERNIESRSIEEEDHSLSKRPVSSETSRLVAGINNSTKNIEQEPKRRHQSLVSDDAKTASQEKNSASSKKIQVAMPFLPSAQI